MSQADPSFQQPECPECGSTDLYSRRVGSAGGHGPALLAGLGGFLSFPKFDVIVCSDCGLTRFYADPDARKRARNHARWMRVE